MTPDPKLFLLEAVTLLILYRDPRHEDPKDVTDAFLAKVKLDWPELYAKAELE